jgi:hypothetical protein
VKASKPPKDLDIIRLFQVVPEKTSLEDVSAQIFKERKTLPDLIDRARKHKEPMSAYQRDSIRKYISLRQQELTSLSGNDAPKAPTVTILENGQHPMFNGGRRAPLTDAVRAKVQDLLKTQSPSEVAQEMCLPYHTVHYIKRKMGLVPPRNDKVMELASRLDEYVYGTTLVATDPEIAAIYKDSKEGLEALYTVAQALRKAADTLGKNVRNLLESHHGRSKEKDSHSRRVRSLSPERHAPEDQDAAPVRPDLRSKVPARSESAACSSHDGELQPGHCGSTHCLLP